MPPSSTGRVIGVTVLPEYAQCESVEAVLDRLQAAGVNSLTTSPYVMEPADATTGAREPPIDAGAGEVRLLDRQLWGQRELWVRTSPSFLPNQASYRGLKYQPPSPDELTHREGEVIHDLLGAARRRGMQVCFQIQAAIPPGYRVQFGGPDEEDQPRMFDGRIPAGRVANNGSLASPDILAYQEALLHDLCHQFPELDQIRVDWPEYPPYSLDDMFVDFSSSARKAADRLGFDFERMTRDVQALYRRIHGGLTNESLGRWLDEHVARYAMAELCLELPGVMDWLRFKAVLVDELLGRFRQAIDDAGRADLRLVANLFPWPWSLASGAANYRRVANHCSAMAIKLYGMHWKMMFRFYCDQLLRHNSGVSPSLVVESLLTLLDIMDSPAPLEPEAYSYPGPADPHGVGRAAQERKIRMARASVPGTPVYALMHGYGPVGDFRHRLEITSDASPDGLWINRYGYLSDAKLEAMQELFR